MYRLQEAVWNGSSRWSIDKYCFIYPNSTQDIKDEAVQQNNCVASYIDKVLDGDYHIIFMRNIKAPDKSLVTLEIVNEKVVQAKRRFNNDITDEDELAIKQWENLYAIKSKKVA